MKRTLLALLAIITLLCFSSCNGYGSNSSDTSGRDTEDTVDTTIKTAETDKDIVIEDTDTLYTTEELWLERDGMKIYGELYLPTATERVPVAILSHGFGGNCSHLKNYAHILAENGIAAYAFDFIGGGTSIKSDGKMTDMSVLTEAKDLDTVVDALLIRDDMDADNLFLLGGSQGGFVSSYVAAKRPSDIKGLIALYPAYVLQDDARERTPDPDDIPETMHVMGATIGGIYNKDAMSFDIYDVIKDYPNDVLIMHGTRDNIVPISYSERAADTFPSAELIEFEDAGHGFYGEDELRSAKLVVDFIKDHITKEDEAAYTKTHNEEPKMKIRVSDGKSNVIFELNDSSAAKSLYEMLPIKTDVENYSNNEKIFYPTDPLDTSDVSEGDGPFGSLAYFSPWGNVVMYYSPCKKYTGLYLMGVATSGSNDIEQLSGTITITKED